MRLSHWILRPNRQEMVSSQEFKRDQKSWPGTRLVAIWCAGEHKPDQSRELGIPLAAGDSGEMKILKGIAWDGSGSNIHLSALLAAQVHKCVAARGVSWSTVPSMSKGIFSSVARLASAMERISTASCWCTLCSQISRRLKACSMIPCSYIQAYIYACLEHRDELALACLSAPLSSHSRGLNRFSNA